MREDFPEVVENWPHLGIGKSFLLFTLELVIDFLFYILTEVDKRMWVQRLRVLINAHTLGL